MAQTKMFTLNVYEDGSVDITYGPVFYRLRDKYGISSYDTEFLWPIRDTLERKVKEMLMSKGI